MDGQEFCCWPKIPRQHLGSTGDFSDSFTEQSSRHCTKCWCCQPVWGWWHQHPPVTSGVARVPACGGWREKTTTTSSFYPESMRPCSGQLAWALSITTGCLSHGKNVGLKCFLHYDGSPQKSPSTDSVLEAGGDESCLLCHFPSGDGRSALLFLYIGLKQFLKITLDCVCVCAERGGQIPCSWNYSGCWEKNTFFTAERSFQLKTFFLFWTHLRSTFFFSSFRRNIRTTRRISARIQGWLPYGRCVLYIQGQWRIEPL